MSDPRKTLQYEGLRDTGGVTFAIDGVTITYSATAEGGSAGYGLAVKLSADKTMALVADGDPILGKLGQVYKDGYCTVYETPGSYVTLPAGDGATVTAGSRIVGALGAAGAKGYIRNVAATGAAYAEAAADDTQAGRHTIVDASTTTAVVVRLD